jgi:hypothetical protein
MSLTSADVRKIRNIFYRHVYKTVYTYIYYTYIYYIVFIKDKLYIYFNLICSIKCKNGVFMSPTSADVRKIRKIFL